MDRLQRRRKYEGQPIEGELSDCGALRTARVDYHMCAKDNGSKCQMSPALECHVWSTDSETKAFMNSSPLQEESA